MKTPKADLTEKIVVVDRREIGGSRSEGRRSDFERFTSRKKLRVETP
jgi:hypothetical protein